MNNSVKKLTYTALFAVLNYVAFAYGKINIPTVAGGSTAIHIANAVVVVSSFILGPVYGGLSGAIGLSIADLMDPRYVASAPKTFLMKFLIGYIAGMVADKLQLVNKVSQKDIIRVTAISALCGLGFNVIFDPIIGYFYKRYILGLTPELVSIMQTWAAGMSAVNGVICVFVAVVFYLAIYKAISRVR